MSSIILALRDLVLVAILMSGGAIVCMHACKHALAAATYLHAPGQPVLYSRPGLWLMKRGSFKKSANTAHF